MKRLSSLLLLSGLVTACASVPMATPEQDRAAKEFRTTPGKSNVYVFRDESIGAAIKMNVLLDGGLFGATAAKTFLLTTVEPGRHTLLSKAENDSTLAFDAVPGANVYVWQEVKMGILMARSKLQLVDEAIAKGRIPECGLAAGASAAPPPAPMAAPVPGA
jgi:hypothetical protein